MMKLFSCFAALVLTMSLTMAQMPKRVQMAYNYCTLSYTTALWSEAQWIDEIDRLAAAGFTHVLVNPGMEAVWFDFLTKKLGTVPGFKAYTEGEARAHIPHPAWRAWWLMGNLEGEGMMLAPVEADGRKYALTVNDIERQRHIGKVIVEACWKHGMTPVLNAFMGLLPTDFDQKYPQYLYLPQTSNWCSYVRPDQLLPTDAIFSTLAKAYHETLFEVYGITADKPVAFSGDLFHEGGAKPAQDQVTTESAIAVQKAMQAARPGSIWFLQHWNENPTVPLMAGCDPNFTLIQKLDKDMRSGISVSPGTHYRGMGGELIPWIWTEVTNFGDNPNLYGGIRRFMEFKEYLKSEDAKRTKCIGWGMLDEGISYQKVYYAKLFDILGTFADETKRPADAQITTRSDTQPAWELLMQSVYLPTAYQEGCSEGILVAEPHRGVAYGHASAWGWGGPYYDKTLVRKAGELLYNQLKADPNLVRDSVWVEFYIDVMRQVAVDAFTAVPEYRKEQLFQVLDALLLRSEKMHLWHYWQLALELSRPITVEGDKVTFGRPNKERALHHYRNYLCLMTIWRQDDTTNASGLHDYSNRNLGGMMDEYYGRRWGLYHAGVNDSTIRTVDAQWWKTAGVPHKPIAPKAKELLILGKAILGYDITKRYVQDESGVSPLDSCDFNAIEGGIKGYSGRAWMEASQFAGLVPGRNAEEKAVVGSRWTTMAMPTFGASGGTISIVTTLGTVPTGVIFSANDRSDMNFAPNAQWWMARGKEAGSLTFHHLFAQPMRTVYGLAPDVFHHIVITRTPNGRVTVWVDGVEELSGKAAPTLPEYFTGYQVNACWGGSDGVRPASDAAMDDLRVYAVPLDAEQVKTLYKTLF